MLERWLKIDHYVKSVRIRSNPVRMWENVDQNNFQYGYFLRSEQLL